MAPAHDLEAYLGPFGLSSFRAGQREVIETVMAGKDCLCVMPTGGGKSLCYQLPAIAQPGVTLVISPLIALMKDQVDALASRGLPATFINSTLSSEEQTARLAALAAGRYKLVYVVPERFRSPRFVEAVTQSNLRLLAVDEAHCVSEWGHDFRPDYARLGRFRAQLGDPPTIALTATATGAVRDDIVAMLNLRDPQIFIAGFARENLFYAVEPCSTDRDKDEALFRFLGENPGSGIVYASTRKRCEELAQRITERTRRRTSVYHAGLSADERRRAQDDFMQGRSEIAVATLAFGMGIDKSDIRFVVHYNLPGSIEAYYQEAGRAGRDGRPARCLLLFGSGDRYIHEFFIESAYPGRDVVEQVYDFLNATGKDTVEMTQQEVKAALNLQIGAEGVGSCEKLLEKAGVIERLEAAENTAAVRLNSELPTLVDLLPQQARTKRQVLRAVERLVGSQRNEWFYFQLRELAEILVDYSSGDISRHLRELATLSAFDYVPPFRGRAVHVRERGRAFDELDIDFETLERRKTAEYERVDHVLHFARGHRCRQQVILSYFGETESAPCGHCDNCDSTPSERQGGQALPASGPVLEAARIVLSGVARVGQRRANCGKQLLAQMLCGSNAKGVVRNRLDKLSTFGLLSHLKQPEVVQLIESLLVAGLLEQTEIEPFRPVVQLTQLGADVMSGRNIDTLRLTLAEPLRRKLAPNAAAAMPSPTDNESAVVSPPTESAPIDPRLHAALRNWRESTCQMLKVPAYIVLSNATLEELARARPRSLDDLLAVKGIGPSKVRQFGAQLLDVLGPREGRTAPAIVPRESSLSPEAMTAPSDRLRPPDEIDTAEPPRTLSPVEIVNGASPSTRDALAVADAGPISPSHYWTWRLLTAGFSPRECAEIRSLSQDVVLDHALRAADEGRAIDAAWFLDTALITEIDRIVGQEVPTRIRRLLDKLPRGTRYEEVQLVLKARNASVSIPSHESGQ